MVLRLTWRCGDPSGPTSVGYKANDPETNLGCQINHLWDRDRRFFYGYEALVGRTGSRPSFRPSAHTKHSVPRYPLVKHT
jgi:hypothetical protein